ncbi:MAG: hypothetical protein HQK81_15165 [Desulfovibrionaceae bacterium]|nr:hypothetical protein [Desulfovibrionaceae bacterium]
MADAQDSAVLGACALESTSSRPVILSVGGLDFRLSGDVARDLCRQIEEQLTVADEAEQERQRIEYEQRKAANIAALLKCGSELHPILLERVRGGESRSRVITEFAERKYLDRSFVEVGITMFSQQKQKREVEIRKQREDVVFKLYWGGIGNDEIASRLGVHRNTIDRIVNKVRRLKSRTKSSGALNGR